MKTLTFHNNTTLDPLSFQTMGLSVKQEGSFGMFGTGLKYALATLLRMGDKVEIVTEGQRFYFDTREGEFRGEAFSFVQCNGEDIGFTTQLGKCWEAWMAYRELYCNAQDEGGDVELGEKPEATTQVIVRGDVLAEVHSSRCLWFLPSGQKPIWENDQLEIHAGFSSGYFYQGVFVGSFGRECPFTVNFKKGIHLSEDRLDKYTSLASGKLAQQIRACSDKRVLSSLVGNKDFSLNFSSGEDPSEEFIKLVKAIYKRSGRFVSGTKELLLEREVDLVKAMEEPFTEREEKMLEKVTSFLELAGYPINRFPIVKFSTEGRELLGHATGFEKISLTPVAFERGVFDLALTVLEEFVHCDARVFDNTREMQDWLFKALLSQAEARLDVIL
jgi:hypothetical protein